MKHVIFYVIISATIIFSIIFFLKKGDQRQNENILVNFPPQIEKESLAKPSGLGLYSDQKEKDEEMRKRQLYDVETLQPKGLYGDPFLPPPDLSGKLMTVEEAYNIDRQYSNPSVSIRQMHPVLAYQYMHDKAINPANLGDPIRIPDVAGPQSSYGTIRNFIDSLSISRDSVPVPQGTLKMTSEKYNKDQFRFNPLAHGTLATVKSTEAFSVTPLGVGLPYQNHPSSGDFHRPYGPNSQQVGDVPFFGSVNAYAPFPEIVNPWEKAGILTSTVIRKGGEDEILNLYRRPIAPLQDLWEYQVQDKNGFVIKLENVKYLENGDLVQHVIGKQGLGPWKVHIFVTNKYVWV
jgi:hypothetical protein